ncbi:MAG: STAS domain-containing protein [Acidobacteria bacterium]|nr:STAS domain-containing protein [Acidobacteriota bacterium]
MNITERIVGEVTVLDLDGRLVFGEGDQAFKSRIDSLTRYGRKYIVLNMRNVSYLDSAGVGVLVWKFVTTRKQGGVIKLANLSPRSHNVMHIAKLLQVFETFDTEEAALESFDPELGETGAFRLPTRS